MVCSRDEIGGCYSGYDYYYGRCCNAGMSAFWTVFLWVSLSLCICLCCMTMLAAMRRRRMQMMAAQNRNLNGAHAHRNFDTDSSFDDSLVVGQPVRQNNRPVYNAPIGGSETIVVYAPPAQPIAPLSTGVRPAVDPKKGTTQIRITLHTGQQATLELNLDHTVAEIHTYVMSVCPTVGSYQLMSGYPPKPLADPGMTIKAAKLQQASVTMRLI